MNASLRCHCGKPFGDITAGACPVCTILREAGLPPRPAGSWDGSREQVLARHKDVKRAWNKLHPRTAASRRVPCAGGCGRLCFSHRSRCPSCAAVAREAAKRERRAAEAA